MAKQIELTNSKAGAVELPAEIADKLNKVNARIKQLDTVLDVVRIDEQNALNRRLVRKQQDGTLGQPDPNPAQAGDRDAEGETMPDDDDDTANVNLGDSTTTYHVYTDASREAGADPGGHDNSRQPVIAAAAESTFKKALPWVLTAASLSGLGGAMASKLFGGTDGQGEPPAAATAPANPADAEPGNRNGDLEPPPAYTGKRYRLEFGE